MKFDLVRPCPHCPFRNDREGYLRPGRAIEIAESLARGGAFPCHETTEPSDDEGDSMLVEEDSQFCAGALLMLEAQEQPNQIMRVAERLRLYDSGRLDRSAPHCRSAFEFLQVHSSEEELEPCCISDAGCEAPAGMLVDGLAVPVEPTSDTHECPGCGQQVCDNCSNEEGVCSYCADNE